MKLDKEEKALLRSINKGEWRSVKNVDKEIKRHMEYARATFRKEKRVNIRISEKDLNAIQSRALEEGIPYQTLMSSVLHKFVSGTLKTA
jgi:predicted DNA binding CopG/RHH family protein